MLHHTIIPVEALQEPLPAPEGVCLPCRYGFVSGTRNSQGRVVIDRIISTDPAAYLDPSFSPGQLLEEPLQPQALG